MRKGILSKVKGLAAFAALAFVFMGCPQAPVETGVLSSIEITKQPTKVEYEIGAALDTAGMEVTATYSNGTKKVVTGWTTGGFDSSVAAEKQTVVVTYKEGAVTKTAGFDVKIKAAAPAGDTPAGNKPTGGDQTGGNNGGNQSGGDQTGGNNGGNQGDSGQTGGNNNGGNQGDSGQTGGNSGSGDKTPALPANVGIDEVAGVTFGNESRKYIFNTDGTVTQVEKNGYPDPSFEYAVYNYSYDSSKKQVVLKAVKLNPGSGLLTCEEADAMFSEMFLEGKKDQLASLGLPPNTSDEDFLNAMAKADGWDSWEAMQQLMYRAMFTNLYVFSYSDNELKPVFNYSTIKEFSDSFDINAIFKNSDESVVWRVFSWGGLDIQDEQLHQISITDTKIKLSNDEEIPYTADLTKPEGQKTVTITWKGTEYTLTQSVISYPKMN